jgi:HEAT repeat protein
MDTGMNRRTFVLVSTLGAASTGSLAEAANHPRSSSDHSDAQESRSLPPEQNIRRDQAWATLEDCAHASESQQRQFALAALSTLGTLKKATDLIANALLLDADRQVRAFAAAILGKGNIRAGIPSLRKALDDEAAVAFAAAKALWDMGDHSGVVLFREILSGKAEQGDGLISQYMNKARKTMRDPKALALIGVEQASGAFFGPAGMAISIAQESFKDRGAAGRAYSAQELADDRSAATKAVLESALLDSSAIVRVAACQSLAQQNARSSIRYIEPLFYDKHPAVQTMAAAALIRLHKWK